MSLTFHDARAAVLRETATFSANRPVEAVPLDEALGRILAAPVLADRDQPPFDRVTRDGFAVRSADVANAATQAVSLHVIGEAPPGRVFAGLLAPGQCVEIMTGAPLPPGADAVVMIEHTDRLDAQTVSIKRAVAARENFVPRGSEIPAASAAFPAGRRLDPAAVALLASLGCARPHVVFRPKVAIVTTGDELVELHQLPGIAQIRNSNLHSIAAQVRQAGAVPVMLPIARDDRAALRARLSEGIAQADVVLASGGVSMGKYDFVEPVLAEMGGRIVFDAVDIRPGRPLVFGVIGGKPFFGLPGNPLSTLVTFRLFVRPALDILGGAGASNFSFAHAQLAAPYSQRKVGLTVFVPAAWQADARGLHTLIRPLPSQGSGDLVAMAGADGLMMIEPGVAELPAGAWVPMLHK